MLTNADIIRMNQKGSSPRQLRRDKEELVVVSDAPGGGVYTAVFNLSKEPRDITVSLADIGLNGKGKAKDLWSGDEFKISGEVKLEGIPSHGCRVLRIK